MGSDVWGGAEDGDGFWDVCVYKEEEDKFGVALRGSPVFNNVVEEQTVLEPIVLFIQIMPLEGQLCISYWMLFRVKVMAMHVLSNEAIIYLLSEKSLP